VGARVAGRRANAQQQQANEQQQLAEAQQEAAGATERAHKAELAAKDAEIAAQGKAMLTVAYAQPAQGYPPQQQNTPQQQQQQYAPSSYAAGPPPPALGLLPPPAIAPKMLVVTSPHMVDEASPAMQAHNIISVPAGSKVRLVQGDLFAGLGAPYGDYIVVDFRGKTGKISRLVCVEEA
jgi:hypothetical protein